jgi:hypothetical protein
MTFEEAQEKWPEAAETCLVDFHTLDPIPGTRKLVLAGQAADGGAVVVWEEGE